jgi:iron complex outermembrane receptor protein
MKGIRFISAVICVALIPILATAELQRRSALEEVKVTSQKRPQLLQDTTVAISVLTSEQLEKQGISGIGDMRQGAIASVRMFESANTPQNIVVAIRGNGTGDPSDTTREGSVGIYLDGVYIARSQGLGLDLADL